MKFFGFSRNRPAATGLLRLVVAMVLLQAAMPCVGAHPGLGQPGAPIQLSVGYMPYYSSTWSGVVMRVDSDRIQAASRVDKACLNIAAIAARRTTTVY